MNEKLAHLTNDQVKELVRRYYEDKEKASALIAEYGISAPASRLTSLFPPVTHSELTCPYCVEQHLVSKRASRTGYGHNIPYCPSCGHRHERHCRCKNCSEHSKQLERQIEHQKRAIIEDFYRLTQIPDLELSVSLKDAIYLLSLSRHSLDERFEFVEPFSGTRPLLAPTYDFRNDIAKHLYGKGYVSISSDSPTDAFVFDDEITRTNAYYPTKVKWCFLPEVEIEKKKKFLANLEHRVREGDWEDEWNGSRILFWHELAKHECLEYFDFLLRQRHYEVENFGEKTHATFENLLNSFSAAQIFNLTWQSVRDTTDYIVKEKLPKYHGKNLFIGAVQRKADKALAEGWDVRGSRRDFNCPQTVVSSTFFDLFLGIGQRGFEAVPPKAE